MPISILIADDHRIFREGLRALLDSEPSVAVVGEAQSEQEVLNLLKLHTIDLILMDIDMGTSSGIDITKAVKTICPSVKIVALTMHNEQDYIIRMLEAGATGYILKNTGREEMMTAIQAVAKGGSYYSEQASNMLIEQLRNPNLGRTKKLSIPLTQRELEVLKLIAEEHSNPEIAEKLFISVRTVDTHRRNLIEKLGVKNTAGLVKYAIKEGLI